MPIHGVEGPLDFHYLTDTPIYTINTTDCAKSWIAEPKFLSSRDLDLLARKIYRIFSEHIKVDISEAEFINLLEESE